MSGYSRRGLPQAPAVCICRTAEVNPPEVFISAAGDPRHQQRLQPGVEGAERDLLANVVQGTDGIPERGVTSLPVKKVGLALPDPSQTAPENWTASCFLTGHLISALRVQTTFRTADHTACLRLGRLAVRHRGVQRVEAVLTAALEGAPVLQARQMRQTANTRAWLTVLPSTINGTELGD